MGKVGRTRVGRSPYRKRRLSSDARLIVALLKNQPQNRVSLCKSAGLSKSMFYYILPLLKESRIIRETKRGYVLWNYSGLDDIVENAFLKLMVETKGYHLTIDDIANRIGVPPDKIEASVYRLVKKYGMKIRRLDSGKKLIIPWS